MSGNLAGLVIKNNGNPVIANPEEIDFVPSSAFDVQFISKLKVNTNIATQALGGGGSGGGGIGIYILDHTPTSPDDNHNDGDITFDNSTSPYTMYVQENGTWVATITPSGIDWTLIKSEANTSIYLGFNGSRIFAATATGVYYSDDIGSTWLQSTGISLASAIAVFDSTTIFAASNSGQDSKIYKSIDNGETFSDSSSGIPTGLENYNPTSIVVVGNDMYVALPYSGIYKSTNTGLSWSAVNGSMPSDPTYGYEIYQIATDGTYLYTLKTDETPSMATVLYYSHDGGSTWSISSSNVGIDSTHPGNPAKIGSTVYMCLDGTLKKSTDGGANWSSVNTPTSDTNPSAFPYSICSDGTNLYLSMYSSVHKSTDNGANWIDISSVLAGTGLFALVYYNGNLVFLCLAPTLESGTYLYKKTS